MRREVASEMQKMAESAAESPKKYKMASNEVANMKFEALQVKCFDDIENVVFKLVFETAFGLTSGCLVFGAGARFLAPPGAPLLFARL